MAKFTFYGGMCMLLERHDGYKIIVDPYITGNPSCSKDVSEFYDVDLVVITHAAFDHFGDAVKILQNSKAQVMCGSECRVLIERGGVKLEEGRHLGTIYGDCRKFGETTIRTVQAWHGSGVEYDGVRHSYYPFGYMIQLEPGVTYYHTGDTYISSEMKLLHDLFHPQVMVVGISKISEPFPCEMTAREAAIATSYVAPDVVIPCHYAPGDPALEEFLTQVKVLSPDTIVKAGSGKAFTYIPFRVE